MGAEHWQERDKTDNSRQANGGEDTQSDRQGNTNGHMDGCRGQAGTGRPGTCRNISSEQEVQTRSIRVGLDLLRPYEVW